MLFGTNGMVLLKFTVLFDGLKLIHADLYRKMSNFVAQTWTITPRQDKQTYNYPQIKQF